jgi:hypothetical protein
MSKVDAMRALREARHAAATKAAATAPAAAPRASTQAAPPARRGLSVVRDEPAAAAAGPQAVEELCGHRNMGGRSCTRELDHVKNGTKNHRYG